MPRWQNNSLQSKRAGATQRTIKPVWLFVLPWSLVHVGGVNQVIVNLAEQMVAAGSYEPIVLFTDWNAPFPIHEIVQGIKVVRWRVRSLTAEMSLKSKMIFLYWSWSFNRSFRRFCKEYGVAVINPHYPTETAFTLGNAISKLIPKPKMIVSVHGADLTSIQSSSTKLLLLWRNFLAHTDALVACSRSLAQKAKEIFGEYITPICIHNGIDVEKFRRLAGKRVSMERRVILSVGKFEKKKGQDVLIKAFSSLVQDYADIDLVLIGASADCLESLRKTCIDESIDKRVFFHADMPHNEVARWFQKATLFVLPSRQEPFGIVLLEAGCLGIPVIASRVGGIPEIINENVTGVMVEPDDVFALAKAMQQILDDYTTALRMGERLRTHITQEFSWAETHEKYLDLAGNSVGALQLSLTVDPATRPLGPKD